MKFHKEGFGIISGTIFGVLVANILPHQFNCSYWITIPILTLSIAFTAFVLWFFRNPNRQLTETPNAIFAPADGKVVVIEETIETEYYNTPRLQVSIFMSPLNVHVNRYPISGEVKYSKYHPGKYLVAWHPKSSTENERTTVVVENQKGQGLLMRQIAGALARRIICYSKQNDVAKQGEDFGFIRFGSRVDLYLPLNAKINVQLNQKVEGNKTIVAYWE